MQCLLFGWGFLVHLLDDIHAEQSWHNFFVESRLRIRGVSYHKDTSLCDAYALCFEVEFKVTNVRYFQAISSSMGKPFVNV